MVSARVAVGVNPSSAGVNAPADDTRKGVQSVDQAFSLLQVLEGADRALAVKEISELVGMPSPKTHHYLVSLVRAGVVRQTSEGRYELGVFALQLGLSALRKLDPVERSAEKARQLRDASEESVFITIWGSHGPTIIRYFEGYRPVTVEVRAGLVLPLVTSATGRVFLTWGNASPVSAVLDTDAIPPELCTDTIRDRTRRDGVGCVEGELLPRIASLSAPVFDRDGRLSLALTTLGWIGEFDTNLQGDTAQSLLRYAGELSAELGFSDNND